MNDSLLVAGPEQDLSQLREMLQADDIEGARSLLKQLAVEWPDSRRVQHLAKVLAPPKVTVSESEPSRPLHLEREWLKENARQYPN